ncbi:unnamed protein product [Paramecium octaurelia]|uniref:Protein kinase domain-containing protein n=1 Tax=Paramecium octaurelia TaxID=43137 RepID=A0A8S1U7U4_PAROT|nr:unnamed protein product [Paramecium octaurelia]
MKIGQYEIDKKIIIAKGSEGEIYHCVDVYKKDKNLCAKIVQKMTLEDFQKQNAILSKLFQHKNTNLVKLEYYGFDDSTQSLIIIMEKCQSTLKEEINRRKNEKDQFSDEEIWDFLKQFLSGYQILYNLKILHRDIKPENILISSQKGQLIYKLTDFGISKVCSSNSMFMTQIGTPIYAPPELNGGPKQEGTTSLIDINDPNPQSKRDIYALGLILHQMMNGELPFVEKKVAEFKKQIEKFPFKMQNTNRCKILVDLTENMIQYYPQNRISFPDLNQVIQISPKQLCAVLPTKVMPTNQKQIYAFNNCKSQANLFTKIDNDQTKEAAKNINYQKIPTQNINITNNQKDNLKFRSPTQSQIFLNTPVNKSQLIGSQNTNISLQKKNLEPQTQRERVQTEHCFQSKISQRPIKVIDVIKQYIHEVIINYECLISEDKFKRIKELNLNQQILSEENEKQIKSIFRYEKGKINDYNFQALLFYYCLNNYKLPLVFLPPDETECIKFIKQKMQSTV